MPGYGSRYWAERTADNRRRSHPKFRGTHTTDAVVIGGGLTGATAAYVLANAGMSVMLLEAERLAEGSTAGGLGAILPQPDAMFRAVESLTGRRVARTAWEIAQKSAADFGAALKKLPTKSDVTASALVINGRGSEDAQDLRKEQTARRSAGLAAPWLSADAERAEIGTDSSGAIRLRDTFLFDPVRATLSLAGAAQARGAQIFEKSPVRRTRFTRKYADVVLGTGTIRTRGIVIATGEPGSLFGQLRRHIRRLDGYLVVTEPLSAPMRRDVGRRDSVLTEAGSAPHWLRWLPDDRALFAGGLSAPVPPRQRDKALRQRVAQLMYEFSVRYPAISGLQSAWGWDVPVVSTFDGLPWIGPHRNYPFHFFAMAFGWQGDGLAWHAARAALRYFQDTPRQEDDAFGFVRHL
ncbi:MAG TPA: FAD-binding oxidoreductase [Vicinamibacterales bacterium]|nr:FAD-binding oxidoreductase [Vicinamibacterales bacterium]